MAVECFLDTNILIYATSFAANHAAKKLLAREWVARADWGVSTQVLTEFYVNARQAKNGLEVEAASRFVQRIADTRQVQAIDRETILDALSISARYPVSHWNALILSAAKQIGARTIISDEIAHGQRYDGIVVLNPFLQ